MGPALVIAFGLGYVGGVALSYPLNTPSGGTIVLVAVGLFIVIARHGERSHVSPRPPARHSRRRSRARADCGTRHSTATTSTTSATGHLHAVHQATYDEHGEVAPAEHDDERRGRQEPDDDDATQAHASRLPSPICWWSDDFLGQTVQRAAAQGR